MARIVVSEFLTLDGVYQGPGGPEEDPSGNFDKGGWATELDDGEDNDSSVVLDSFEHTDGLLLGRRTYDIFANFWPNVPADEPYGKFMNRFKKYIVSTTLSEPLSWQNSTLISGTVDLEAQRRVVGPIRQARRPQRIARRQRARRMIAKQGVPPGAPPSVPVDRHVRGAHFGVELSDPASPIHHRQHCRHVIPVTA